MKTRVIGNYSHQLRETFVKSGSANPHAVVGGGVDHAIHKAAGAELLKARKKIGDIAAGTAAITR